MTRAADNEEQLTYASLLPLTRLRHLQFFSLACNETVSMTDRQLSDLLSACPVLATMHLNCEPPSMSPTDLTINVIPILANSCPWLENLHLYVDGTKPVDTTIKPTTFKKLRELSFGVSPLSNVDDALALLAQVIPTQCKFVGRPVVGLRAVFNSDISRRRRSCIVWEKIETMLPFQIRVRDASEEKILGVNVHDGKMDLNRSFFVLRKFTMTFSVSSSMFGVNIQRMKPFKFGTRSDISSRNGSKEPLCSPDSGRSIPR